MFKMGIRRTQILLIFGVFSFLLREVAASPEHDLVKTLLEKYDRSGIIHGRPVSSFDDKLTVTMGMSLMRSKLDTIERQLTADVWLTFEWTDEYLKWDSSKYGDVTAVHLRHSEIWTPDDIALFNEAEEMKMNVKYPIVVDDTGRAFWVPLARIVVDCELHDNGTYTCPMKFGSWSYDGSRINVTLSMNDIDMSTYHKTGDPREQCDIVFANAVRNVFKYDCCPEPYISVTYTLGLRRS